MWALTRCRCSLTLHNWTNINSMSALSFCLAHNALSLSVWGSGAEPVKKTCTWWWECCYMDEELHRDILALKCLWNGSKEWQNVKTSVRINLATDLWSDCYCVFYYAVRWLIQWLASDWLHVLHELSKLLKDYVKEKINQCHSLILMFHDIDIPWWCSLGTYPATKNIFT